jgi:hypothetical protein
MKEGSIADRRELQRIDTRSEQCDAFTLDGLQQNSQYFGYLLLSIGNVGFVGSTALYYLTIFINRCNITIQPSQSN